ncbi:hypothetical protein UA74_29975 [Actinoalloteichus fjordicus]|uniref:Uncharacterized protein n=1 Tax=Actinoalloteichus fjordicus TaxID=1612552 RepID=A0AAC9LHV6_9PSEU|nr:hypothetical protein UA74_29975 [Actinoalloteichus fjordicus]
MSQTRRAVLVLDRRVNHRHGRKGRQAHRAPHGTDRRRAPRRRAVRSGRISRRRAAPSPPRRTARDHLATTPTILAIRAIRPIEAGRVTDHTVPQARPRPPGPARRGSRNVPPRRRRDSPARQRTAADRPRAGPARTEPTVRHRTAVAARQARRRPTAQAPRRARTVIRDRGRTVIRGRTDTPDRTGPARTARRATARLPLDMPPTAGPQTGTRPTDSPRTGTRGTDGRPTGTRPTDSSGAARMEPAPRTDPPGRTDRQDRTALRLRPARSPR